MAHTSHTYRRRTAKVENQNKNSFLNQTITSIIILIFVVIINLNKSTNEDGLKSKLSKVITSNSIKTDIDTVSKYVANIFNNVSNKEEPAPIQETQNVDRVDFEVLEKLNKQEEQNYEKK